MDHAERKGVTAWVPTPAPALPQPSLYPEVVWVLHHWCLHHRHRPRPLSLRCPRDDQWIGTGTVWQRRFQREMSMLGQMGWVGRTWGVGGVLGQGQQSRRIWGVGLACLETRGAQTAGKKHSKMTDVVHYASWHMSRPRTLTGRCKNYPQVLIYWRGESGWEGLTGQRTETRLHEHTHCRQ